MAGRKSRAEGFHLSEVGSLSASKLAEEFSTEPDAELLFDTFRDTMEPANCGPLPALEQ